LIAWLPALLLMALILMLSSRPEFGDQDFFASRLPPWFWDNAWLRHLAPFVSLLDEYGPNLAHLVEYGLLAIALATAGRRQGWGISTALALAWLGAVLFGLLDEAYQGMLVPNRHASWADVRRDALGAGAALVLLYLTIYRRPKAPSQVGASEGTSGR
jgi:VanZ family protein